MSKRRISHQQSERIKKKQTRYREETPLDGLVIQRYSRHALVESADHGRIRCAIRPTLDSLVAGDRVVWQLEDGNQGVVVSQYPRQSVLGRPDKHGVLKPVAANISQIMIVIAPKPEIIWPLLDSYLVMATYLGLTACIILNKTDMPCDEIKKRLVEEYESLSYCILYTNAKNKTLNKQLEEGLDQQISVFVGQSGVGKSSLIARVLPLEEGIQTGEISSRTELGQHTTSSSRLYHLPTGGALIDSPGIREFGLWQMPLSDIAKGYREFAPYLPNCKFRNCNHIDAPHCAVLEAVHQKNIALHRYKNYVKITHQFIKDHDV